MYVCVLPFPCRPVSARNQGQSVKFKVRDKEHVLGVVVLSLASLGSQRESDKRWLPLAPHKKGHEVSGELLVECFVSKFLPGPPHQQATTTGTSLSETSSPISSRLGSQEDILQPKKGRRFSLHGRAPTGAAARAGGLDSPTIEEQQRRTTEASSEGASSRSTASHSRGDSEDVSLLQPQVTGVSPHEGPMQGGQRVVLRGSNLGESRQSVVKVLLADVDCTASLEYFSASE